MNELLRSIERTIKNLGKIRRSQSPPSREITNKLISLRTLEQELISVEIDKNTDKYKAAITSLSKAIKETKNVIDKLTKVDLAIKEVSDAIEIISKLKAKKD
ncbi:hypothetical protein [Microbulbifer epialgicus]|uniref:Uncharacterized protein n=1 Tax=Microbulbifer epialgicus TaxID=393907 RepID=A0ABV4P3S8_9GAMM